MAGGGGGATGNAGGLVVLCLKAQYEKHFWSRLIGAKVVTARAYYRQVYKFLKSKGNYV